MTVSISFDVTVEVHEPSGAFVARAADFPGKVGIGTTEAEAVADLRQRLPQPFLQPISSPSTVGPWYFAAPPLPDDELTAEWKRIIQERRDVFDTAEPERD